MDHLGIRFQPNWSPNEKGPEKVRRLRVSLSDGITGWWFSLRISLAAADGVSTPIQPGERALIKDVTWSRRYCKACRYTATLGSLPVEAQPALISLRSDSKEKESVLSLERPALPCQDREKYFRVVAQHTYELLLSVDFQRVPDTFLIRVELLDDTGTTKEEFPYFEIFKGKEEKLRTVRETTEDQAEAAYDSEQSAKYVGCLIGECNHQEGVRSSVAVARRAEPEEVKSSNRELNCYCRDCSVMW